ncbi:peptidase C39 family protein [Microbacterium marinilacus]|uniref:Acetyltransferase n=1 Tax=Microbacterium marinilacus TaxID=415209 RepID=A0ABP7BRG7_9MICO|nr:peptidase C39 family protein [Microbacterium marinilacus]MBY0690244.1 peptidase C39 family protein [Microbacterium marinilacus]
MSSRRVAAHPATVSGTATASGPASLGGIGVEVVPFDRDALPDVVRRLAPAGVQERWAGTDRAVHEPRLVGVPGPEEGEWSAAALVTARPGTAYVKIVDAVGDTAAAVAAVIEHARRIGAVQVKWEGWTASPADAEAAGFVPLAPAIPSGPVGGADSAPTAGYVRWLAGDPVAEPPYYRQSTDFSCGAVVALVAQARTGTGAREDLTRDAELSLWRGATNFPACEPVGLGVAVRRTWPGSEVTICLDVDRPVVLAAYPEPEREWRAVLQRVSRADAAGLGVPIDARRLTIGAIRDAVDAGERVLLLISLGVMQGLDVPHWVLCHAAGPGVVVIDDPWTHVAAGETWVDAHLLPVPDTRLDAMSALEDDGFRGAVRLGARAGEGGDE